MTVAAVTVLGAGGLYFVARGGVYLSTYLKSTRSDPVAMSRLSDDSATVELAGTARAHEQTVRARFSDTETLICESEIVEGTGDMAHEKGSDRADTTFLLEDDTGAVLVDPAGATLQMETTSRIRVDAEEQPPEPIAEFLDSTEWLDTDTLRTRRYIESRIDPGDEVHVYGPVREVGHSVDLPAGVDAVVGASDPHEGPVDVTNLTVSGIVDRFMSDVERVFIITTGDEPTAAGKLRRNGLIGLAFGVPLLALAIGIILIGGV